MSLTTLPKSLKNLIMVAADVVVLPLAFWTALALRLGEWRFEPAPPWWIYALTIVVSVPIFLRLGLYRAVVRYMEARAFRAIIVASFAASVLFALAVTLLHPAGVPVTALLIYTVLSSACVALTRLIARQWLRHVDSGGDGHRAQRVAVYGAGAAGRQLVQALRYSPEFRAVVFVDDNPDLHGRTVMGLAVHNSLDLGPLVKRMDVGAVILAIPSLTPGQRSTLLRRLESLNTEVRLLPGMADLIRGSVGAEDVRSVSPEDLLGRDPVQVDDCGLHELLRDRTVLVTGAGGSIGSELCRQIVGYQPKRLVLFDISEFALYALREEFVARWPSTPLVCAVGDVKNAARVRRILTEYRPSAVFHAAAYKHVPLMEEVNAWEALRNNSWGTYVLGRAAIDLAVEKFVLVSTDKAVNPTNVMGATKRLAEMVCQSLHSEGGTRFEMVRFGNVLGSSGSVIPKFREQIARGGPVTVTHPEIVRYFMSIPEAAQLVLQAACMGQGGEVFVLDMGEPVRIVDLARKMIRLSGRTERDISIEITGLRPGEKLFEELLADSEFTRPTHHPKIRVAKVAEVPPAWAGELASWVERNPWLDDHEVRGRIATMVPEYRPWGAAFRSPPVGIEQPVADIRG